MKTLYITAAATILAIATFFIGLKLIDRPLGGEPYTVITIKDRQKAEGELAKKNNTKKIAKAETSKQAKRDKAPQYFSNRGTPKDQPTKQLETSKQRQDHQKTIENQLEYIAKIGLPPAPDPKPIEKTKYGLLPHISDEGLRPLKRYARPANLPANAKNTIALVITGLGLSQPLTELAIEKLPPTVTLSFNPYASQLKKWTKRARRTGHESILEIPMEPFDYPDNDPGPHSLLSHQSDKINIDRLNWLLSRMVGYVGIINLDGGKFISDENALFPVMREIKNRGLLYMDMNPEIISAPAEIAQELKLEYLKSTMILDEIKNKKAIDKNLASLIKAAKTHGTAIGIAAGSPLTIQRISNWTTTLKQQGITLVPLTFTIPKQQT